MSNTAYKVLTKGLRSPYRGFQYELNKWYEEKNFGETGDNDCKKGLYATPIEGLLFRGLYHENELPFLCETKGDCIDDGFGKQCWRHLKIVRRLEEEEEVRALSREAHERLGFTLEEALYPINPLRGEPKVPTEDHIKMLKEWASVMDSVGYSVNDSVMYSVMDSFGYEVMNSVRESVFGSTIDLVGYAVMNSVYAYIGSLFPNIIEWIFIEHKPGVYPFKSSANLWRAGFVSSFDRTVGRLRSGKNAEIVYETTT